jgi:predicted GNAT superfamily acetyltransferase
MSPVRISVTTDPDSCRAIEEVQREVWGQPERSVVPAEQVRAVVHNGGMLLLAHDDDKLVGFCYAFVGVEDRQPILCSHMLAVRPAARGRGIGKALKMAQRDFARERGFAKITWTFDPLQARNAYLNLSALGAYARRYFVDHYGAMDDEINRGMATDRLLAEWLIASEPAGAHPAVRASAGEPAPASGELRAELPWILGASGEGVAVRPGKLQREHLHTAGLVAVPADIEALRRVDPQLHHEWRLALRTAFQAAFAEGLVAVAVYRDAEPGTAAYVLRRGG